MDCIWEDLQPRAAVSLTLQSVDGQLRRIGRLSQPATTGDTASFSQAEQSSTTARAKPNRRCDFVHIAGSAVEAVYEILNAGLRGQHTDSNQRLIYTWAWASPQKCRAAGLVAAVKSHLMTASF